MEAKFTRLEALVASMTISMVAHTNALFMLGTLYHDQDDILFLSSNQGYFCGVGFSRPLASNDEISYVLRDVLLTIAQ